MMVEIIIKNVDYFNKNKYVKNPNDVFAMVSRIVKSKPDIVKLIVNFNWNGSQIVFCYKDDLAISKNEYFEICKEIEADYEAQLNGIKVYVGGWSEPNLTLSF